MKILKQKFLKGKLSNFNSSIETIWVKKESSNFAQICEGYELNDAYNSPK
jgi:hypothetical protein